MLASAVASTRGQLVVIGSCRLQIIQLMDLLQSSLKTRLEDGSSEASFQPRQDPAFTHWIRPQQPLRTQVAEKGKLGHDLIVEGPFINHYALIFTHYVPLLYSTRTSTSFARVLSLSKT